MGGMTRLLLLLWAGVTVSTVVDLRKRIIGGKECEKAERLYHVMLRADNGSHSSLCGGSLISKHWILTAAHCWVPGKMTAYVGVHQGQSQAMVINDPPEIFTNTSGSHDIMLLKLPQGTHIAPVKLPDCKNPPKIGDPVQMAGYAATTTGPNNERVCKVSSTLQCAVTKIVDCQEVKDILNKNYPGAYARTLYQHWQCYQSAGVDTCKGDSGGGVVYNDTIYGVHSFTSNPTHAFASASAFMDVCKYKQWIENTKSRP